VPNNVKKAGLLEVSHGFKLGQTRVFSISDPHFAPFSDMSMGHKIFLHGQISALLQYQHSLHQPIHPERSGG